MTEKKEINVSIGRSLLLYFLLGCLGYFVYGQTLSGVLATVIYAFGVCLISVLGFIPFVGPIFSFAVSRFAFQPWLFDLTGIYSTWLTTIILAVATIFSIVSCLIFTLIVISLLD